MLSSKVIERDGVRYVCVEGAKSGRPREREVRTMGLEDTGDRRAVAEELGHGRESVTAHYALIPAFLKFWNLIPQKLLRSISLHDKVI